MMSFRFLSALFSCLILIFASAPESHAQGKTEWTGSAKPASFLDAYRKTNALKETIPGFRLQIHSGGDRDKAREVKAKFLAANPGWSAYESYQSPNFRVRVGDFRSRLEASKALKSVVAEFPSAFVVEDDIHLPPLEP